MVLHLVIPDTIDPTYFASSAPLPRRRLHRFTEAAPKAGAYSNGGRYDKETNINAGWWPSEPNKWQQVTLNWKLPAAAATMRWYIGYPTKSTAGHWWATGLELVRLGGDGACGTASTDQIVG